MSRFEATAPPVSIPAASPGAEGKDRPRMISSSAFPARALRWWELSRRFQKFLLVGAVGLAVNQGLLVALHDGSDLRLNVASPIAIFISMVVTFLLNEHWTWHDRGSGRIVHRVMTYLPINSVGLLINWGLLTWLVHDYGVPYLVANLFGAGVAAVWNFVMNHIVTWRD